MSEETAQGSTGVQPAPEGAQPTVPEKYRDKTPDDLIRMLEEREQSISKQGAEVGDLRKEIERTREEMRALELERRARESMGAQPQGFAPPEPKRPTLDEEAWDYQRPVTSTAKIVDQMVRAELDRREQSRMQYEQQVRFERAKMNFVEGRDAAYSNKTPLYEGIEGTVENALYAAWADGRIHDDDLRRPKTWETMAQLIRLNRGEVDKLTARRQGVTAPLSDTPTQVKQGFGVAGSALDFDESSDALLKGLGQAAGITSREQAADLLRGARKG